MALRAIFGVAVALITAAPAMGEWRVVVSERGGVRSSVLVGFGNADPKQQLAIICTTLDGEPIGDPVISFAVPSTGQFTVRAGDAAEIRVTAGGQAWDLTAAVDENDSSGFAASVHSPDGSDMAAAAGKFSVAVSSGDISLDILIGPEGAETASRQFLEACGV